MGDEAPPKTVTLSFDRGTLILEAPEGLGPSGPPEGFREDPRVGGRLRGTAIRYRRALAHLIRDGLQVDDQARDYQPLGRSLRRQREPFPHQAEALESWLSHDRRGVVVLPTGAGKSYVAELAINQVDRSTLVVAPTIDLMTQWMNLLGVAFGEDIVGGLGGGMSDIRPLTATTYDSAYIHMERIGGRFGLVVFDECHHLPGASYAQAAESSIAPFRLGLTATPERQDGSHDLLDRLIGPTVYRRDIRELTGEYLAGYDVVRFRVALNEAEREAYEANRAEYKAFVASQGIRMSRPDGWAQFIQRSSRSTEGRRAWRAWREQKRIALQSQAKLDQLSDLLWQHRDEQVLVFTADNDTVYAISRRHLIPAITHQTPASERKRTLKEFNEGRLKALVTSRVLNEGVDMPAASVGVVLSGSGSVREHVQRLGRILRKAEGKHATLYEVITGDTGEEYTSDRRRDHGAYR
ncbi:MAG: DEAD/DEAH box helicase family protein [Myxococcota bacterium]|nr:DEAD/DEAH box helicase family protein [Myxococcota bacterium]MEE2780193.1 DEAD/DEAH box helicase family protein [Myxococcota bacterium]